ncbi:hypothetical protein RJ639_033095 [Escallonia herrerae]|uniref:UvrD-like helicase ATP-binding domain-containing protein n=1 Tax=Escallonia herrerae TaxID=1293975 RepID=A0AA88X6W8_9ASTE|nr:hypothetical protein RJ639_033095 [Escallonia herrerae]
MAEELRTSDGVATQTLGMPVKSNGEYSTNVLQSRDNPELEVEELRTSEATVALPESMPEEYAKYMQSLNDRQREAACSNISVPLMIVAGAGSGKGIGPCHILAMTFTTAAASEMRDRIGAVAGKETGKELMISTFHSFSLQLCRLHAEKYKYLLEQRAVHDVDGGKLLNEDNDLRSSKGLEWDTVFIVKANESEIPLLHEYNGVVKENGNSLEVYLNLLSFWYSAVIKYEKLGTEERAVVSHLFHQWAKKPAFQDPKRLLGKVGFVVDERLRARKCTHKDALRDLKSCLRSDEALQYAEYVLKWEQIPADKRAYIMREKQEHFQKLRIDNAMGSRQLHCVPPELRMHSGSYIPSSCFSFD